MQFKSILISLFLTSAVVARPLDLGSLEELGKPIESITNMVSEFSQNGNGNGSGSGNSADAENESGNGNASDNAANANGNGANGNEANGNEANGNGSDNEAGNGNGNGNDFEGNGSDNASPDVLNDLNFLNFGGEKYCDQDVEQNGLVNVALPCIAL